MNRLIGKIKNKDYYCPKCGSNSARGRAEQVGEDVCEMWIECGDCGWSGDINNRLETIWGWENDYVYNAFDCWKENIDEFKKEPNHG